MTEKEVVEKSIEMCSEKGHTLLYLTRYGSKLFGTSTPKSDDDYRGIYLPKLDDVLM